MTEPQGFKIPMPDLIVAGIVAIIVGGGLFLHTSSAAPPAGRPASTSSGLPPLGQGSLKDDLKYMGPCPCAPISEEERARAVEAVEQWKRDYDAYLMKNGLPPQFKKDAPPVVKPRIAPRPSWQWRVT